MPELLLGVGHGPAVDIWALGVIAFELLTGYPPFNDATKELVFQRIVDHNMLPVEDVEVSVAAWDFITACLAQDPSARPTAPSLEHHGYFGGLNFATLRQQEPPFVPHPDSGLDTAYFEGRNRGKLSFVEELTFAPAGAGCDVARGAVDSAETAKPEPCVEGTMSVTPDMATVAS